jgi:hypothetical protein
MIYIVRPPRPLLLLRRRLRKPRKRRLVLAIWLTAVTHLVAQKDEKKEDKTKTTKVGRRLSARVGDFFKPKKADVASPAKVEEVPASEEAAKTEEGKADEAAKPAEEAAPAAEAAPVVEEPAPAAVPTAPLVTAAA